MLILYLLRGPYTLGCCHMLSSYLGSGRDNIRLKSYKKEDAKKKKKKRERINTHWIGKLGLIYDA